MEQNSEYWENRIANETWKTYNDIEEKNINLLKMYERSSNNIKKELLALAEKAEKDGALGRTEQYRFNKLLGQQGAIFKECERLGEQIEKHATGNMNSGGTNVYKNVMESLSINEYTTPNKKMMENMMRSPWKGSFFSERLWRNMEKLECNLNGVINNGISTGKTITEMAVSLSNIMNSSFNDTHRLVRTETINHMNRSALRGYKDAGIKEVQWWAAVDERTCLKCGAGHSKPFDVEKAPILPCHPGCRCTWLPVTESIEAGIDEKLAILINEARVREPSITKDISEVSENIGTVLEGLKFRRKEFNSLSRKVQTDIKLGGDIGYITDHLYDNVRYTSVSNKLKLAKDYATTIEELTRKGYTVCRVKNTLKDKNASYRGINTVIEDPNGYRFELQFHTEESFNVKQKNHTLYEEQRLDTTTFEKRIELETEMKKNNVTIGMPLDIFDVITFDKLK